MAGAAGTARAAGRAGATTASPGNAAVRIEKRDRVTTVILDRAHAKNAVDGPTAEALAQAFREFDADADSDVAVLCGAKDRKSTRLNSSHQ